MKKREIITIAIAFLGLIIPLFIPEIRNILFNHTWKFYCISISCFLIFFAALSVIIRLLFKQTLKEQLESRLNKLEEDSREEINNYKKELLNYKTRLSELTDTNNGLVKSYSNALDRWVLNGNIDSFVIRTLFFNKQDEKIITEISKSIAKLIINGRASNNLDFLNNESYLNNDIIKAIKIEYHELQKPK